MLICSSRLIHGEIPPFFIDFNRLQQTRLTKDLGVLIDNNLDFSAHINDTVRRASCRANLILKCFTSNDTKTMMRAFLTYVRPTLEYASPIWSPHTLKDITAIESVQRRFTKRLTGLFDLNYHDRLSNLGLETLELRRKKMTSSLHIKLFSASF